MLTDHYGSPVLRDRLTDSLNYFLIEISGQIQLTKTKRDKAAGHYEAIGNVLKESPPGSLLSQLDVKMRPFGGLGTDTAVHPYLKDEFDLDLVIQFMTMASTFGAPHKLYYEVFNRLNSLDSYKTRLEKKSRCIRVYYAGEFYLDLMPAALYMPLEGVTKLWIPEEQDNGSYKFVLVDPLGLMKWFEDKCKLQKTVFRNTADARDFEMMPLLTEEANKPALKQACQLIKRMRDKYFYSDDDCRKILKSVVILTVAGNYYSGERDIYHLVKKIITAVDNETRHLQSARVENPVHPEEDFLQGLRENEDRHKKLRDFISHLHREWDCLADATLDLVTRQKILKKLFGETVTEQVLDEYGKRVSDINKSEKMRMMGGGALVMGTEAGTKVPRHQFFGDL